MKGIYVPIVCPQCENPLCIMVCPLNALSKDSKGIIKIDHEACIGCKLCFYICPIGAITIDPDVGVAMKCDQCDGDPICIRYCPSEAISCIGIDKAADHLKRAKAKLLLELIT
ncbi:4Fe-4S dicluster domain-containing protein [[Eubacterium] cellulosolvens]